MTEICIIQKSMGNTGSSGGCNNWFCDIDDGSSVFGVQFMQVIWTTTFVSSGWPDNNCNWMQTENNAGPCSNNGQGIEWGTWERASSCQWYHQIRVFYDQMTYDTWKSYWYDYQDMKFPTKFTAVDWRFYNKGGSSKFYRCWVFTPPEPYYRKSINGNYLHAYIPNVRYIWGDYYLPDHIYNQDVRQCSPGTWFTCKYSQICSYEVPLFPGFWNFTENNDYFVLNINDEGAVPIGSCYPCVEGYDKIHYNVPNNVVCSAAMVRQHDNPLNAGSFQQACKSVPSSILHPKGIFCPGGMWPPVICDSGFISSEDYTHCICPEGTYDNLNGQCVPCEPGYYCKNSVRTICPDDTYQDQQGMVDCKSCDDGQGSSFLTCGRGTDMLPAKCLISNGFRYKTARFCVKCSMCYNPIMNNYAPVPNALQCYEK